LGIAAGGPQIPAVIPIYYLKLNGTVAALSLVVCSYRKTRIYRLQINDAV
jgi:hypothetical protein